MQLTCQRNYFTKILSFRSTLLEYYSTRCTIGIFRQQLFSFLFLLESHSGRHLHVVNECGLEVAVSSIHVSNAHHFSATATHTHDKGIVQSRIFYYRMLCIENWGLPTSTVRIPLKVEMMGPIVLQICLISYIYIHIYTYI